MRSSIAAAVLAACACTIQAAGASAAETVVTLEGGIDATVNIPDGSSKVPAVVMLHGFGSSKDEVGNMYAREAEALAEKGIASIRISFRGYGKSDGDTGNSTIDTMIADTMTATKYISEQPGIDPARLGVLGFSLGGGIAVVVSGQNPDLFKSRVTWSSVGDFMADMTGFLPAGTVEKAQAEGIIGLDLGWRTIALKKEFFESLKTYSIKDALAKYTGAYMSIAGSADFSAKYAEDYVAMAPSAKKAALVIPNADHIYEVLSPDQKDALKVIGETAAWFADTL